ncbi:diguanylate cyclase [Marinobacter guineae]|uniref:diguanylate cyclase n=1 Tax=Marinobacter guineae TaxID=432303 RepID=A0A2G1VEK8_9GAMM|nr:diguanylate cyclase [Marinobacter guineae]PHQ25205.1 diguanylate cyclase [Marinobacter guineae]
MALESTGKISSRLEVLRQRFLERAKEDIQQLRTLAEKTRRGEFSADGLLFCYQSLHRLSGSAGTFGLPELGEAAKALEKQLKVQAEELGALDDTVAHPVDIPAGFADGIDALAELVEVKSQAVEQAGSYTEEPATYKGSQGMQVSVLLVEKGDERLAMLEKEMAPYGFSFTSVNCDDAGALGNALAEVRGAAAILCRESALSDVMSLRNTSFEQSSRRRLPVICLGSDNSFHNRYRVAEAGAFAFFPDPVDIPELAERIESLAIERSANVQGRVLIVEDDAELAEHYCLVLQAAGIEAQAVSEPLHLMSNLADFEPDIVLMDVQIGEYSGVTLARLIRFEPRWLSLPIIYLSSEDDPENQLEALSKGADEFLMKPVSDSYLVRSVRIRCYRARQLSELMNRDSLTGLLKHSLIKEEVEKELARCRRSGERSCVVMLDLDHFKTVNDTWGHSQGDIVIRTLANLLRNRLRETDMIGRYGGEEFLVVLPECDVSSATELIRGIGESFSALFFVAGESSYQVTLSAGIAAINDFTNGEDALNAADQALYERKRGGRKGVTVYSSK